MGYFYYVNLGRHDESCFIELFDEPKCSATQNEYGEYEVAITLGNLYSHDGQDAGRIETVIENNGKANDYNVFSHFVVGQNVNGYIELGWLSSIWNAINKFEAMQSEFVSRYY